jgi:hypothetical protein
VSRAMLRSAGGTALSLGRVQGRWALREPVAEVAEPEAVAKLFGALSGVRIIDFLDPAAQGGAVTAVEEAGFAPGEEPAAVLVLESDLRDAGDASSVLRRVLEVGRTADLAGRNVYARVRHEVHRGGNADVVFERLVVVSGEQLAGIAMDPAAYISRRSFASPPSEVGGVVLKDGEEVRRYERTLDGWQAVTAAGSAALSRADSEGLGALLQVVMQAPASRVVLAEATTEGVQIELLSLGGLPIGEALIVFREGFIVHSRGVARVHDAQASQGAARWLAGMR